jgi:hypothetical protein
MTTAVQYREVQRFPFWMVGLPCGIVLGIVLACWLVAGLPTEALVTFLSAFCFVILLCVLVLALRLVTEVDEGGVRILLTPLAHRRIRPDEIDAAYVRTYRPLWEYGGWGIRWGWAGRAYNARGNRGVQLVLKDGARVLIGSQQPDELLSAIRAIAPQARMTAEG